MLIDYFINKPQHRVTELSQQMDLQDELKRQHHQAFKYRLKRFAVSKVLPVPSLREWATKHLITQTTKTVN